MSEAVYRGYGVRPRPPIRPLERGVAPEVMPRSAAVFAAVERSFGDPFVGITTGGTAVEGLFPLAVGGVAGEAAVGAARAYLDSLTPAQRARGVFGIDAPQWRRWTNAFPTWEPHGNLLDDLDEHRRGLALAVVRECLSPRGFGDVRTAMYLNAMLGQVIGDYPDTLAEWVYWFSVFGDPAGDKPWGWQLIGHHLDVHCFVLGDQLVLTPTFVGAEVAAEDFHGSRNPRLFAAEQERALEVMGALSDRQKEAAWKWSSLAGPELPERYRHRANGRHQAGMGADNLVLPYEGLPGAEMTKGQRDRLLTLAETYIGRMPAGAAASTMADIERHLDDTHFMWIGSIERAPFYYRIHSPVILIEFDQHSGIFLDNDVPEPFHVHTIVRTPNGNDYGKDLLRQHYQRLGHRHGHHIPHHDHDHNHHHDHDHDHDHDHSRDGHRHDHGEA